MSIDEMLDLVSEYLSKLNDYYIKNNATLGEDMTINRIKVQLHYLLKLTNNLD